MDIEEQQWFWSNLSQYIVLIINYVGVHANNISAT